MYHQGNITLPFQAESTCLISKRMYPSFLSRIRTPQSFHVPSTFFEYLKVAPVTLLFGIGMGVIWFICWNNRVDVSTVGIHYNAVVKHHELYRIFTASFSHLSLLHFAFNCSSLFSFVGLEVKLGSVSYFL